MTIHDFYQKYQGVQLEDAEVFVSEEFKVFVRDMRSALKQEVKKYGIHLQYCRSIHYFIYGFFEKGGKLIFFSYQEPRSAKIDLERTDPTGGFLYRIEEQSSDFQLRNHFTHWYGLIPNAAALFDRTDS